MLSALSRRERNMISLAVFSVILLLLVHVIFLPVINKRNGLATRVDTGRNALREMEALSERYRELQGLAMSEKTAVMQRDRQFTLFSFIDRLARESNVKDNVSYMKPSTRKAENGDLVVSSVKVKLDGIVIGQVVDLLYMIESSDKLVKISSLSISKGGEGGKLSSIIEIETIMPSEEPVAGG